MKQVVDEWMTGPKKRWQAARAELDARRYSFAINRAYYAAFYAASAVLLSQGRHFVKHAGVHDGAAPRPRPYRSAGLGARQSVRRAVRAPADRRLHGNRHRRRPGNPLPQPSGSPRRRNAPAARYGLAISSRARQRYPKAHRPRSLRRAMPSSQRRPCHCDRERPRRGKQSTKPCFYGALTPALVRIINSPSTRPAHELPGTLRLGQGRGRPAK